MEVRDGRLKQRDNKFRQRSFTEIRRPILRSVKADFLSLFFFMVACTLLFFIYIFLQDTQSPLIPKIILILSLLFAGVLFAVINKVKIDTNAFITKRSFLTMLLIGSPILVMPLMSIIMYGVSDVDVVGIVIFFCSAVAEEWFFRAGVFVWLKGYTRNYYGKGSLALLTAYLGTSLIFMIYHVFAYGGAFLPLLLAFFGSIIFCALVDITNNLSPSILTHTLYNILVGIVTGAQVML